MFPHKTVRQRVIAGVAVTAVFGLAACSSTTTDTASSSDKPIAKEDIVLVASVINTTNPYMASMIEGAKALSTKLGVPLEIVDSQGSSQVEISKIQAIIAQGKKVVLMVNTVANSDVAPIVKSVKQSGGYVTIWWNKPDNIEPANEGDHFVAFQKHSGVESGRCLAKKLAEGIGEKGNVLALAGVLDSNTSQTRVAGFKDGLKAYPNIKLLDTQPANWDPQLGFKVTQSLIAKYGDKIDGMWAADDAMIIGAIEAMKKAGRADQVKFVSDGLYPPVLDMMKTKANNNAVVGETFHRGYMAASIGLYTAYLAATGKIKPSELPPEKRNSLFKISCVDDKNLDALVKYDSDIPGWIDTLIKKGPWDTNPVELVGAGPEKIPS